MGRGRAAQRVRRSARGVLLVAGVLAAGCAAQERHLPGESGPVHQLAITPETPPFYVPRNPDEPVPVLVEERVELPVRRPSDAERMALWRNVPQGSPYPRRPWLNEGDVRIEVDWVVHNLDTAKGTEVVVLFNGFNEFHEYVPWAVGDGAEEPLNNFSQWERRIRLGPGERRAGTIREDDTLEAARDLAILAMGPPNFNLVVHPQTRGLDDPRLAAYRPALVPGLLGFRMGLMTERSEDGAGQVLLEFTVRLRDMAGKLAAEGERPWHPRAPELLLPPPPPGEE